MGYLVFCLGILEAIINKTIRTILNSVFLFVFYLFVVNLKHKFIILNMNTELKDREKSKISVKNGIKYKQSEIKWSWLRVQFILSMLLRWDL
jgi:hypothetical protein